MSLRCGLGSLLLVASLAALSSGCSSTPYSIDHALGPDYHVAVDGLLQYRVPTNWFDAKNDARIHDANVWLVRNDYGATITVAEVKLDAVAQAELRREGLSSLAQLTMTLAAAEKAAVVLQSPESLTINDMECYAYELALSPNDTLRVILMRLGTKVYEVTALASGDKKHASANDVFSIQDNVVQSFKW